MDHTMLVISRRIGESILLYRGRHRLAEISLTEIRGTSGRRPMVHVGIDADDEIKVLRPEHVDDYIADAISASAGGA